VSDKRPAYRQILLVFLVLAVLTAIEFTLAINLDNAAVPLFLIALVKAGLIVQYFMHVYRLWREEEH
jgi:cytochrome c oxidase subunit 4